MQMLSDVMEDYLKAIYELQRHEEQRVSTSALADYLDVRPPTVTSMLSKLSDRDLVDYEKYGGVELSAKGETIALEVLRHHRLIEAYLAEFLDYDWSEVHDEADALEHHISEEFEQRIAASLDDPAVDPHGDPIPTADLRPVEDGSSSWLADHSAGDVVVVERVSDRDPEELSYLANIGVEPGRELMIHEVAPIGLYVIEHDTGVQHLPESIAESIRVRRLTYERSEDEE